MNDEYLTLKDIQQILKISRNTAYQLMRLDTFPSVQIGKQYRVSKNDFNEFMAEYRYSKINLKGVA